MLITRSQWTDSELTALYRDSLERKTLAAVASRGLPR